MIKLPNNDFLGAVKQRIHNENFTVSIVNYHQPVSEDWHFHDSVILCLILQGGNRESRKKDDTQALPGNIMLYNQGEVHRNTYTEYPSQNLNLELKESFFLDNDLQMVNFDQTFTKNLDAQFQLLKIYQELRVNDFYSSQAIYSALVTLFTQKSKDLPTSSWLKHIQEILYDRWDEFISLKELSEELQVHPVTISKYFPQYFNCSLSDFMRKVKVEKALYYLKHSAKALTEIAGDCGFSDQSHFIRVFKAYTGLTPRAFKKI